MSAATRETTMSHLRDVRRTAAARTIGERHPWTVLYGATGAWTVLALAVLGAATWLVLRASRAVSGWWQGQEHPAVSRPVSQTVSAGGVVSWVPWWGWVLAAATLLVLIRWAIPRLRFKMKYGMWPL